ncbi:MAG: helicase-related protein [Propionicimonas sp.]|uniref:helicase-related protein n=1 Tax=Propionicimonas sp. TaxID=1955623 RepID=UPI003D10F174
MRLEDILIGAKLVGVVPGEHVDALHTAWHGQDAVGLVFRRADGSISERVLYRADEDALAPAASKGRPFDAPGSDFKLAAEAQRITLAGLFDPMVAVATSAVEPLPHQLRAVYGELLPRTPLRFLLADDPGAGKTIMAGLYIKELILRQDVRRCLVVAPGGLVDQWQDELFFKFGLRFDILSPGMAEASLGGSVFERHPLLIARMDQLSRTDELLEAAQDAEWDLVVVDEAHRMSAHYFGNKLTKTRRFQLGELLASRTRHLLLMTATPHSGKEEDFQLFLSLLDPDGFEGRFRQGVHDTGTQGLMRRMVKEDLLTFEGRPLFPERIAITVPYRLSDAEEQLYQQVTEYVREGMNRADRLDDSRRNTVGFALTVLQRRLASSPEAIHQSLIRRAARLRQRREALERGETPEPPTRDTDLLDADEFAADDVETIEEELVDAATAARTIAELDVELADLDRLVGAAAHVVASGTDRKWAELRTILESGVPDAAGGTSVATDRPGSGPSSPQGKLIVFTEHRDTLNYLRRRIATVLGRPDAVVAIHGGVQRTERRRLTEEFTKNPDCRILLATDAAGEGLNLQAAHLMVNYDLPWNPNRIEQRFGRIHRIGQTEVCRLWNLVADNTREGEVFTRLLGKIEEQRQAYGGKVFDVLGEAFAERPLRELLIEAVRYGEQPEVRARMEQVIDERVAEGLPELIAERALAAEVLNESEVAEQRRRMDEARVRRLQPHYIELAFRAAFTRLGGRLSRREAGRFEITHVPAALRVGRTVATRYERVAFDQARVEVPDGPRADLLAPGHPLHDAVMAAAIEKWGPSLERGTVLVSPTATAPSLLVGVVEEITDATGASVARRFGYAFVDPRGTVRDAGPAPYLDCVALPEVATSAAVAGSTHPGIDRDATSWSSAEVAATSWFVAERLPAYLAEVGAARAAELQRARERVVQRLHQEINRLAAEAIVVAGRERAHAQGGSAAAAPRGPSAEALSRRASELEARLDHRLAEIDRQRALSTRPPRVVCAALVIPASALPGAAPDVRDEVVAAARAAVATKEVERRGVELVLASERALGRSPVEQPFNNPGFDVLSGVPGGDPVRIEVKARIAGADDFFVTHNEVIFGRNAAPRYRLALVRVDPRGPDFDEVRYLDDPFAGVDLGGFDAVGHRGDWSRTWAKAREPF